MAADRLRLSSRQVLVPAYTSVRRERHLISPDTHSLLDASCLMLPLVRSPALPSLVRSLSSLPLITVPKYLDADLKRHEARHQDQVELLLQERQRRGNPRIPVIRCKHNPKLDMFYGQKYPRPKKRGAPANIPLASAGWMRGDKYRNDEIVFTSYERNPLLQTNSQRHEATEKYFNQLPLHPLMVETLASMHLHTPSLIQSLAIPLILSGANCTISAETGCGKTIAYLAPLIQLVAKEKEKDPTATQVLSYNGRRTPRAIVVVPGRELADQVAKVAERLGAPFGVGVATMVGGPPLDTRHSGYDVIVTTLGLMKKHWGKVYSSLKLQHLVLDEADTLLDDSNNFDLLEILARMSFKTSTDFHGTQLVLVSATVPREITRILGDYVDTDSLEVATTPMLHQIPGHITQKFIRINRLDRDAALLRLAHEYTRKGENCIIFSNRTPMSNWIFGFLRQNGVDCVRLNKSLEESERLNNYKRFQSGDCDFLSCTNLASRGLDTKRAQNVINFECPAFVADYIHRIGRVGRLGTRAPALVTSFVSFKPDVALVQQLELAVRTGRSLEDMDANIKRQYRELHARKAARFSAIEAHALEA